MVGLTTEPIHNERLAHELQALGVYFVGVSTVSRREPLLAPPELIAGLAASNEARLRLALIPLFLQRFDLAQSVPIAVDMLTHTEQITLKCYYTAASLLQKKYVRHFRYFEDLPDLFSCELLIPQNDDPTLGLKLLAYRHALLSGDRINWLGTYEHAVQHLLKYRQGKARSGGQFICAT